MILLFLALVQINLYSNKNTYLLGEDIWIRWEFANTGNRSGNIEKCNEFWILNYGYYEIEIIEGEEYFPIRKYFKMRNLGFNIVHLSSPFSLIHFFEFSSMIFSIMS